MSYSMLAEAWIQGYKDFLLNVSRSLDPEWFYTDTLGYFMRVRLYGSYYI